MAARPAIDFLAARGGREFVRRVTIVDAGTHLKHARWLV